MDDYFIKAGGPGRGTTAPPVTRNPSSHDVPFGGRLATPLLASLAFLAFASAAGAQQRPLVTEDPEPVGAGHWSIVVGADWNADRAYPAAGLTGDVLRLALVGVNMGLGSIGELQIDGGFYNRLAITHRRDGPLTGDLDFEGDVTSDVEDLVVATKVRVSAERERWPAVGVRFATRLPNANSGSGLGLDTMDLLAALLVGKSLRTFSLAGNAGLRILGDPVHPGSQNPAVATPLVWLPAVVNAVVVKIRAATVASAPVANTSLPAPPTSSRSTTALTAALPAATLRVAIVYLLK